MSTPSSATLTRRADFQALTRTLPQMVALLAGSGVSTDAVDPVHALTVWESSRRFIATAITRSGSILDYGCANGFLLRSLQEWCPYELQPFGVDIDPDRLAQARMLYSSGPERFCTPDQIPTLGMAGGFDVVYWAVGDNVDFRSAANLRWLRAVAALTAPTGRLVLGFYDTPARNQRKIDDLQRAGVPMSGGLANPAGEQAICWIDEPLTARD